MTKLFYWPKEWAKTVGFHKPAARPVRPHIASSSRALSPPLDQGGTLENLMQGIWQQRGHSPHNRFSTVVVLASASALANPTTPASAVVDPFGPPTVPAGLRPLADAGVVGLRRRQRALGIPP